MMAVTPISINYTLGLLKFVVEAGIILVIGTFLIGLAQSVSLKVGKELISFHWERKKEVTLELDKMFSKHPSSFNTH